MEVIEAQDQMDTEEKRKTGFHQLMNLLQEMALLEHLHFAFNFFEGRAFFLEVRKQNT